MKESAAILTIGNGLGFMFNQLGYCTPLFVLSSMCGKISPVTLFFEFY